MLICIASETDRATIQIDKNKNGILFVVVKRLTFENA
jgi:hypothetical protein